MALEVVSEPATMARAPGHINQCMDGNLQSGTVYTIACDLSNRRWLSGEAILIDLYQVII